MICFGFVVISRLVLMFKGLDMSTWYRNGYVNNDPLFFPGEEFLLEEKKIHPLYVSSLVKEEMLS
jgi:hypothetical protein